MSIAQPIDLREMRQSAGLLISDLPASKPTVIALEHGRRMPGGRTLQRLAEALGRSTEEVWAACQESTRRAQTTGSAA